MGSKTEKKPWINLQNEAKRLRPTTFAIAKLEERWPHGECYILIKKKAK